MIDKKRRTPTLGEMLQDGAGLVGAHALWHHVEDVVHYGRAQLQIEMRLDTLFRHLCMRVCVMSIDVVVVVVVVVV